MTLSPRGSGRCTTSSVAFPAPQQGAQHSWQDKPQAGRVGSETNQWSIQWVYISDSWFPLMALPIFPLCLTLSFLYHPCLIFLLLLQFIFHYGPFVPALTQQWRTLTEGFSSSDLGASRSFCHVFRRGLRQKARFMFYSGAQHAPGVHVIYPQTYNK